MPQEDLPSVVKRVGLVGVTANWNEAQWENRAHGLATKLSIPQSAAESAIDWRAHHRDAVSKLQQKEVTVALLYAFAKNTMKVSRSLKEMCKETDTDYHKAHKYLSWFVRYDGLTLENRKPEEYAAWFGQKMGFPRETVKTAIDIIGLRREAVIDSASPRSIGAGALYVAQGPKKKRYTQWEMAKITEVKEYTLREQALLIKAVLRDQGQGMKVRVG